MEIVDLLTKNLGVSPTQAMGGSGLLLKLARSKMSAADFARVSAAVPDAERLIGAAPATGGGTLAGLEGMLSGLGGPAGAMGSMTSLAAGFSKLGMDSSMISRFASVIIPFIEGKGVTDIRGILEKVLL